MNRDNQLDRALTLHQQEAKRRQQQVIRRRGRSFQEIFERINFLPINPKTRTAKPGGKK